jgi:hypothetical protein
MPKAPFKIIANPARHNVVIDHLLKIQKKNLPQNAIIILIGKGN